MEFWESIASLTIIGIIFYWGLTEFKGMNDTMDEFCGRSTTEGEREDGKDL